MKREFLKGLELTDEQITQIMAENGKDIETTKGKSSELEAGLKTAKETIATYEATIKELEGKTTDSVKLTEELEKLKLDIQTKADAEEKAKADGMLTNNIVEAFGEKKFVNDYTKNALIENIKQELAKQENAGKGIADIFGAITKDKEGIFANEAGAPPVIGGMGEDGTIKGDPSKMDYNTYKTWRKQQE